MEEELALLQVLVYALTFSLRGPRLLFGFKATSRLVRGANWRDRDGVGVLGSWVGQTASLDFEELGMVFWF